jgi:hypothetical protein
MYYYVRKEALEWDKRGWLEGGRGCMQVAGVGNVKCPSYRERFLSLDGRGRVPPKRRLLQEPHGVTSQKTAFFRLSSSFSAFLAFRTLLNALFPLPDFYFISRCVLK